MKQVGLKKICSLILLSCFVNVSFCQPAGYWQQQVDVQIKVSLNDKDHALAGDISMRYQNNSPDTLHFIWIHLWPNAYKNDRTAFSEQLLQNGRTDFYFSSEAQKGYINRLSFKVDDKPATAEDHPQHQDIVKLMLPTPLPPGGSAVIETPFQVKLPAYFSRSGHINQSYMLTQWYPKPAVYDKEGWHAMPYLDQGEFYSEFGNYHVEINLPSNYKVASTGTLRNSSEKDNIKSLIYEQENIHDFAWFADKEFEVLHDTLQLASKIIDVYAYYNKANQTDWANSLTYIKRAILTKSKWLGEYPYNIVSVVEKAGAPDGGGMEYPTITLISNSSNDTMMDILINHEVGHNWFYGILASNERKHPWLDEGMNSFYDMRYNQLQYSSNTQDPTEINNSFIQKRNPSDWQQTLLQTITGIKKDQPIATGSEDFSTYNYGLIAYTKAANWMQLLETKLGTSMFDSVMQEYYQHFKFRHPTPSDFKTVAEDVSGKNLDELFALVTKKGSLTKPTKKDVRFTSFFNLRDGNKHNYIALAPALGYNFYDRLMIGAIVHNYTLPFNQFQFFVAPLYATGSKQLNGIARAGYTWYPGSNGQRATLSLAAAKFTGDNFKDSTGKRNSQPFSKIVPSFKFTFANKDARSTMSSFVQWKTFFIEETGLQFSRDTMIGVDIISYPKTNRTLNQLQFVRADSRALYPYDLGFLVEQGKGFVRANFTRNYFFNYAKSGGLAVRLFAGKFFYTGDQDFLAQFQTERYHLNMTGPKGNEDYTYSNYFAGRNEFEGFYNQQIMIRDGAFKVRTDLLSNKIGKTDNWLAAVNFVSSIPKNINPLALTPLKIPLKFFVDIGTNAEAWEANTGMPKFLYDAGLQVSLLKNTINIYVPLLYSKVYKDYFKSTITEKRFVKNISFSIDLQNASIRKVFPQIPL